MQGRVVVAVVGLLTAFFGLTMLVPAAVALAHGETKVAQAMVAAAALAGGLGWIAYRGLGPVKEISVRDGFAIVTLSWTSAAAFGCLPFLFSGAIPSVTGAFFETMSGLTTTGATVMTDLESVPRGILLWRSLTHWLGGMGIIVLSVAIMPILGIGGMQLLSAEIPGLTPDRLRPRVRQTATLLWGVYALLTAAEVVLLLFGGMSPFDAVNHAFATMATGGFSTRDQSIGAYESAYIEYVVATFCLLAGMNFTLHYSALVGRWGAIRRNLELRVYLAIVGVSVLALTLLLVLPGTYGAVEPAFRAAYFQVASLMTTTGFATADYERWVPGAQALLFILLLVGGCTGSTSGSVKVLRHVLVAKEARVALRRLLHPRGVFVIKLDKKPVPEETLVSAGGFLLLYLAALCAGTLALAAMNLDVATSLSAVAATLGNVGPGFGLVGPTETYAGLPAGAHWTMSFLMLLGRLEIFTVLILFTRGYWRG